MSLFSTPSVRVLALALALLAGACSSSSGTEASTTSPSDSSASAQSSETPGASDSAAPVEGDRPNDDVEAMNIDGTAYTFGEVAAALPGTMLDGTDVTGAVSGFIASKIVDGEMAAQGLTEPDADDEALIAKLEESGFDGSQPGGDEILTQIRLAWHLGELDLLTDAEVEAAYDADPFLYSETCSRHILVETEAEAQAIFDLISGGADFAETAIARSTGPSGPEGGDLGCNRAGVMVPEFDATLSSIGVGELGGPTQTQFGWHVMTIYQQDRAEGEVELQTFIDQLDEASTAFLAFASGVPVDVHPSLGTWSQEQFQLVPPFAEPVPGAGGQSSDASE